jgi:hypothetical protein
METHEHVWEPGAVLHEPARICECGRFEQVTKTLFKDSFKIAFWRWLKEYDDQFTFGGYMKAKKQRIRTFGR